MPPLSIAFFGDVVGLPGMRAFAHAVRALREAGRADLVLVNAENARNGSGLSPEAYKDLRRAGADAISLGDHCFKDKRIADLLDDPEKPVARPANLAAGARGKTATRVPLVPATSAPAASSERPAAAPSPPHTAASSAVAPGLDTSTASLHLVTVLGRLFMPIPADDPFAAVDREVGAIAAADERSLVIVEVHAEATSEKNAMAWHCLQRWPGRVVAVVGTHTHVQTADARLLGGSLAAMTDLGMCGGHSGIIGRKPAPVLEFMTRQNPIAFDVAEDDPRACGCVIRVDPDARRALSIEPVAIDLPAGS